MMMEDMGHAGWGLDGQVLRAGSSPSCWWVVVTALQDGAQWEGWPSGSRPEKGKQYPDPFLPAFIPEMTSFISGTATSLLFFKTLCPQHVYSVSLIFYITDNTKVKHMYLSECLLYACV